MTTEFNLSNESCPTYLPEINIFYAQKAPNLQYQIFHALMNSASPFKVSAECLNIYKFVPIDLIFIEYL